MGDQNKKDETNLKFDTFLIKIQRFFKKYELRLSKVLIVISFIIFLFESIILSFLSALNELSIIILIFLLIGGGCIILIPIGFYLKIIKQLNSTQTKSYEMIGAIIFLIASIVNYFPEFTIFYISPIGTSIAFYPGNYIIAIIASSSFILMDIIFVPKTIIRITKYLDLESIKSSLEKRIHFLEEKTESLEQKFNERMESMERIQNFENSNEVLKIYADNLANYERLIFRKHQLYQLENDPKILRKLAK